MLWCVHACTACADKRPKSFSGHAEAERHARSTESGDDFDMLYGMEAHIGLLEVLGIDSMPSFGDGEIRHVNECLQMTQNQAVDFITVEKKRDGVRPYSCESPKVSSPEDAWETIVWMPNWSYSGVSSAMRLRNAASEWQIWNEG